MIIKNIKELKIQYDEGLKLMRVQWVGGAEMRRFRAALEQLQKLAEQLRISIAVLDFGDLPDISAYDQIWLGTHWLPKVWAMPLTQVSLVMAASQVYNQQAVELLLHLARPFIKYDIQFFRHVSMAMSWLFDQEPRLPNLLAEWEAAGSASAIDPSVVAEPRPHYG